MVDVRAPATRFPLCGGAVALVVAATLMAHDDDPKGRVRPEPYRGPGYRAAVDGGGGPSFPASGVELHAWLPLGDFGIQHTQGNDCWGYVSPGGREYAIMGLECGTGFVDITDPGDPQIIDTVGGPCCTWRDVKVFQHHAYVVSECGGNGIQVIDLARIEQGVVTYVGDVGVGGPASHNVALDPDSGFLYRTGGTGNGLLIYDLNADPASPPLVGQWPDRYVHDAQVVTYVGGPHAGREIAFLCSGDSGGWVNPSLDILDVTDKGNIQHLSAFLYPNGVYSHQGWLSEDRRYFYLGDELDENGTTVPTTTFVIDVTDLASPFNASSFTNQNTAVGHNLYSVGSLLFEANYRSGLRVFDASDPLSPVEVAYFDTYPENDDPQYSGLWSNYPYFPSGTIIGSDRNRGLFVWRLTLGNPADVNGDGVVNVLDLLAVLSSWGPCVQCPEDINGDGQVDVLDLLEVLSNWG